MRLLELIPSKINEWLATPHVRSSRPLLISWRRRVPSQHHPLLAVDPVKIGAIHRSKWKLQEATVERKGQNFNEIRNLRLSRIYLSSGWARTQTLLDPLLPCWENQKWSSLWKIVWQDEGPFIYYVTRFLTVLDLPCNKCSRGCHGIQTYKQSYVMCERPLNDLRWKW